MLQGQKTRLRAVEVVLGEHAGLPGRADGPGKDCRHCSVDMDMVGLIERNVLIWVGDVLYMEKIVSNRMIRNVCRKEMS